MFIVFGTIFPNLKFVFAAVCAARLVPMQSDEKRNCSTVKQRDGWRSVDPNGGQPKTALWLWVREMNDMISIHQRSARTNEGKITLILSHCVMNGFIIFCIMFVTASALDVTWRLDSFTVAFRGDVRGDPASENSPQSILELRNGPVADLHKLLCQPGSKNGVIWKSDTCVNFVVPQNHDVFALLMMHKTRKMN